LVAEGEIGGLAGAACLIPGEFQILGGKTVIGLALRIAGAVEFAPCVELCLLVAQPS